MSATSPHQQSTKHITISLADKLLKPLALREISDSQHVIVRI